MAGRALAAALAFAPAAFAGEAPSPQPSVAEKTAAWAKLPDWSGVWKLNGPEAFDPASLQPKGGVPGKAGVRERAPYTAEWEAKYAANVKAVAAGKWEDPFAVCGTPAGVPRMMHLQSNYEFVVTPKQIWVVAENRMQIRRIYTDGRRHMSADDLFDTYTGNSVGTWEGDTLVVDTIGLREDTVLDKTGLVLSAKRHVVERIRRTDPNTLEIRTTVTDPVALSRPWTVVRTYRRQAAPARVYDSVCAQLPIEAPASR